LPAIIPNYTKFSVYDLTPADLAMFRHDQTDFTQAGAPPPLDQDASFSSSDESLTDDDDQEKGEDEIEEVDEIEKVNETISQDQTDKQQISVLHISTITSGNTSIS
jgi:hypothetical protein